MDTRTYDYGAVFISAEQGAPPATQIPGTYSLSARINTFSMVVRWFADSGEARQYTVESPTVGSTTRCASFILLVVGHWELNRIYAGVRNFVINLNVQIASDEATARREKTYLNKLNMALVQVC